MIKNVKIIGKNTIFKETNLEFSDFNLATGKNGSGKSTFFRYFQDKQIRTENSSIYSVGGDPQSDDFGRINISECTIPSNIEFFDETRIINLKTNSVSFGRIPEKSFAQKMFDLFTQRINLAIDGNLEEKNVIIDKFNKHFKIVLNLFLNP